MLSFLNPAGAANSRFAPFGALQRQHRVTLRLVTAFGSAQVRKSRDLALASFRESVAVLGGVEHAVLHLLYSRFWHKVLYDCDLVTTKEPFQKLFNQGMIDKTLLVNVEVKRIDRPGEKGFKG